MSAGGNPHGGGGEKAEKVYEWTTLHVSGVPLDTPRAQLEAVFSDVGPVKKCFVVKGDDNLLFVGDCKTSNWPLIIGHLPSC